jgi:hypothetical protein
MGKLVGSILMMLTQMRLAQRLGRISGAAKWAALAALCGLGAVTALLVALWVFLIPRLGPEVAALAMAGLFAVLCLGFALAARATLNPGRTSAAPDEDRAVEELKALFAKHKGTALLSAVLAGMAMANGKR